MPPSGMPTDPDTATRIWDTHTYFDANNILMFVYNTGNVAYDDQGVLVKTDGFYFPFTGDINDILDGTEDRTVVYCAGLWLGGKVGDDVRLAVAEYSSDFYQGPMLNGTYQPDCAEFQVYKIDKSSGPGDPDYDGWPFDDGAPADIFGDPLLIGDQTLWAVFNDANAAEHNQTYTDPLGIEVQQTVWSSDNALDENALYIKYKLYNEGDNIIDSCFIAFWADPDVGAASDDFVGCDSSSSIFFGYNDGTDPVYGSDPPAWGGKIISGPVVPSPGDTAIFDGHPMPGYRNLGMTSFSKYINGTDPQNFLEVFNFMRGLWRTGDPVINPITGEETMYFVSGDPVTGEGWVDPISGDRRLMATMGPFSFNPGDSQILNLHPNSDWNRAVIDPEEMYRYYMYAFDPIIATVHVGNLSGGYTASDIDQSSVVINDSIVPISFEVVPSHAGFTGEVLKLTLPVIGFIRGYGPLLDINERVFTVSGQYNDSGLFMAAGAVTIIGKMYGDADGSGYVDVDDVVFLLHFMFTGGPAPSPIILGDNDCSGDVDIDDVVYLIEYIFAGGHVPRHACR
jgi:hypothetical protein